MTLTAPWSLDAQSAVTGTLRDVVRVRAMHPSWSEPVPLQVVAGTVVFDEAWSPHVQATLDCVLPPDQATLDLLDPRDLVRVLIDTGYTYPGGVDDVHPFVNLGLRARDVLRPTNVLRVTAMSDEMLLQDAGVSLQDYANPAIPLPTLLTNRLPIALGYTPTLDLSACPTAAVPVAFDAKHDLWGTFKEAVDVAQGWLRDRGDRTWVCTPWPTTAAQPVHELRTGPGGTLTDTEVTLSRESWANAVAVTYTDPAVPDASPVTGWAYIVGRWQGITTAPGGSALPGLALYTEQRSAAATQAQATAAAQAVQVRKARTGRSAQVVGRTAWWVRAGSTVSLRFPLGPTEQHLVSRVSFDLATGGMTVMTRQPDNTPIATGA